MFGLDAARHCVFLPRLGLEQFVAAIGQCDVVLDSIGWSGGNSTLEGLAQDTPIVTMGGPLMRGRHTMAILQMMGVTDTTADTIDDYVTIAARLGRDPQWRASVRQRMSKCKHLVYRDSAAIDALEAFFDRVARHEAQATAPWAADTGEPPPAMARNVIALDAPAEAGFARWPGSTVPRAGDLRIASQRNAASRDHRRVASAVTELSTGSDSGRRSPRHADIFQHEGA